MMGLPAVGGANRLLGCLLARSLGAAGLHTATAAAAADAQHTAAADLFAQAVPAGSYRPPVSGSVLKRHGRDLTLDAAEGRLDPLIGRQDVIERALQVLLRRTKNNPVLIGDPGVGKTAVAEGIAQLIVSPAAPPGLAGRALIALDVGSLVAGTQYRGAFEERLTSLLNEVRMAAGRVILFIDELHLIMDAGRVEGGMNAANLLKPALARGELHCIGATTVEEYRKHIEADGAFARRFQPVMVEEPAPEEAVQWLRGLRGRYERYHGVRFTDAALSTAVTAAQRYIPERRLPDSAIDVIDEAAARARLHSAAAAAALAAAQAAEAAALEAAVAGTGDPPLDAAGQSFAETQRLMEWLSAEQKQQQPAGQAQVQAAAATYPAPAQLYSGAAGLSASATHALSCPHCGTPASPPEGAVTVTCARCRFKFLSIPQEKLLLGASLFTPQQRRRQQQLLQRALGLPLAAAAAPAAAAAVAAAPAAAPEAEAEAAAASGPAGASAAPAATVATPATATLSAAAPAGPPVIDAADILAVVAEASGIPAEHLSQTDWQPLADLEGRLRQRVVGQDAAVAAAAGAVRLGRLGLQRGAKPLASLLLTGPAGVGKGTLCAALAEALFGSGRHLLRFNLAEFADRASVSRLVGAPPGYVGYGDGGLLSEGIRRRPHSVVLLERVDRAHPEVASLIAQVLETGQLTDSMGKRCDFRNAILALTTSPTALPLPSGASSAADQPAGGQASSSSSGSSSGSGDSAGTTTVSVPETHVHPEAQAGGERHASGHSAAAMTLQPDAGSAAGQQQAQVHPLRYIPAELLARLDAAVSMRPLGAADMRHILELQLADTRAALEAQGVALHVDEAAQQWLADRGLSPVSGARRLQPLLREQLLLPVADALLARRLAAAEPQAVAAATAMARLAADGSRVEVSID